MSLLNKGFTLIELMIVIAVISVLAVIAIPAYQNYIARAQLAEALSLVSGLKIGVVEYTSLNAECPSNQVGYNNSGAAEASQISGKYVASVSLSGGPSSLGEGSSCMIAATMRSSGVSKAIANKLLVLQGTNAYKGSFRWVCWSDAEAKYLPSSCMTLQEALSKGDQLFE